MRTETYWLINFFLKSENFRSNVGIGFGNRKYLDERNCLKNGVE